LILNVELKKYIVVFRFFEEDRWILERKRS